MTRASARPAPHEANRALRFGASVTSPAANPAHRAVAAAPPVGQSGKFSMRRGSRF